MEFCLFVCFQWFLTQKENKRLSHYHGMREGEETTLAASLKMRQIRVLSL